MMKKIKLIMVAILAILFSSCNDDRVPQPLVDLMELGYNNSQIGYVGSDLHIEADIVAEGLIESIRVEILPENNADGWVLDSIFSGSGMSDLKNITFHKHIDISADADTGDYTFHMIVKDQEGQQTTVEEGLVLQFPNDTVPPEISVSAAPGMGQIYHNGDVIAISGVVSDDIALGGLYIGLVRVDQNLSADDVNEENTITLLHSHEFDAQTMQAFSAEITVGAAMDNNINPKDIKGDMAWQSTNYYVLVKCKDAFGAHWTMSEQYPISLVLN